MTHLVKLKSINKLKQWVAGRSFASRVNIEQTAYGELSTKERYEVTGGCKKCRRAYIVDKKGRRMTIPTKFIN